MADITQCWNCGETLAEPGNTTVDQPQPCPKCGSTRRIFAVEMTASVSASAAVTATLMTYPSAILAIAQSLIDQGHFNIAIVTSHMACEVATERALCDAYAANGLQQLGEAINGLMNGYNLANTRNRKLYNALTGTHLETQQFWGRFETASKKRNSVVHRGYYASKAEAETGLAAARDLIDHLGQL